jgi:hypothetical protein
VVLDLDEKVLPAEDVDEAAGRLAGLLVAAVEQVLRDERGQAAGEGDQALGVFRERVEVGAGLVVEAAEVGVGHQLEEVLVAGLVARQQAQVEDRLALVAAAGAFQAGALDEVDFAADERLDAPGLGLL